MGHTQGAARPAPLYTPRLLALSTELAAFPLSGDFEKQEEARSRTCGSTITLGVNCSADTGTVSQVGMQVSACAIGQSSAAVLAMAAQGRTPHDFREMLEHIRHWLQGERQLPEWPDFDALAPALPHRGRHGALLLPWTAMEQALSSPAAAS